MMPKMKKMVNILHIAFAVAFGIGMVAFCFGCGDKPQPPKKPKIVSKKVPPRKPSATAQKPTAVAQKATPPTGTQPPTAKPPGTVKPGQTVQTPKPGTTAATRTAAILKPKADISKPGDRSLTFAVKDKMVPMTSTAVYNPAGKIDPFVPLIKRDRKTAKGRTEKRKKRVPMTPLEELDISQFKLAGIIIYSGGNKALVEDTSGKGYIIKTGTYIGMKEGRVVAIKKDRVIVEEYEFVKGKEVLQKKEMTLPKPPGEL